MNNTSTTDEPIDKVTMEDIIHATPKGQEAVTKAMEESIKDQEEMIAKARDIDSLDDLVRDFLHDFTHGYDTAKSLGQNVGYHTFDTIVAFEQAIKDLFSQNRGCIDCKKLRCEDCERLWQT